MAFSPKSPKARLEPRQALPVMRPRCCFLYLTFFGINMAFCTRYPCEFLGGSELPLPVDGPELAGPEPAGVSGFNSCFQFGWGGASGGKIGAVRGGAPS